MQSQATTVEKYLADLPADRRAAIETVRKVILKNLDKNYEEGMQYGMIGYYVPHRVYPAGYHCNPKQPLPFAALASQKNYMSLYLMSIYGDGSDWKWFQEQWIKSGKKLDMGKCCVRFKKLEDVPLDVVAQAIKRVPAKKYIEHYESVVKTMSKTATAGTAKSTATRGRSSKSKKATRSATSASQRARRVK